MEAAQEEQTNDRSYCLPRRVAPAIPLAFHPWHSSAYHCFQLPKGTFQLSPPKKEQGKGW